MVAACGGYPNHFPPLALRHGVRPALQGYEWPASSRSTRWSSTTTRPAPICSRPTPTSIEKLMSGPRLRPRRLLRGQRHVRPHQPPHGGCDGEPRHARAPPDRPRRGGGGRGSRDRCLSLENIIDYHAPYIQRKPRRNCPRVKSSPSRARKTTSPTASTCGTSSIPEGSWSKSARSRKRRRPRRKDFPEAARAATCLLFLLDHAPSGAGELRDPLPAPRGEPPLLRTARTDQGREQEELGLRPNDTPVFTEAGLISMAELVEDDAEIGFDGDAKQQVYDHKVLPGRRPSSTTAGLTQPPPSCCGSTDHQGSALLPDGRSWRATGRARGRRPRCDIGRRRTVAEERR